ncbi:MAG: patatin family protein, partial [Serratia liquefaciens]|nr:patatin family protein [Serratia liquefaciens]
QFIEKPPGKLRIFEIFPPKPLASNALGSRLTSLNQDYHLGRRCGRYFLATVGHWLVQQDKLDGMKVKKALSRRLIQPENVVMPSPIITDVAHPHDLATAPEANRAARDIILPGDVPPGEGGLL